MTAKLFDENLFLGKSLKAVSEIISSRGRGNWQETELARQLMVRAIKRGQPTQYIGMH